MELKGFKTTKRGKLVFLLAVILVVSSLVLIISLTGRGKDRHKDLLDFATVSADYIAISPKITSQIADVTAIQGCKVDTGDALFTLDNKDLKAELKHAEAMYEIAKQELDRASQGARVQEIVAAQTLVLQANADYESKVAGRASLNKALLTLNNTYSLLLKQMNGYKNPTNGSYDSDYAMQRLNYSYDKKTINDSQFEVQAQMLQQQFLFKNQLEAQMEDLRGQLKTSNKIIEASRAAIQNAESRLELVSEGVPNKEITILVSKVKAAKITYDKAKENVASAQVKAPLGGTIMSVLGHKGEVAVPGTPVVYIANLNKLYIAALADETRLDEIKLGQKVNIKAGKVEGNGTIEEIGASTAATYSTFLKQTQKDVRASQRIPVIISIEKGIKGLIPGMSVKVAVGN